MLVHTFPFGFSVKKEFALSILVQRKLARFVRLSDSDRQALAEHSQRVQHFHARSDLIKEGEDPHYVNLILEGWGCRYKQLEDGRRQIIAFFLPGDMCDPTVYLLREMSHALAAITPVKVARLTRDEMKVLMGSSPTIERAMWLDMLASAEIQREWTVSLGRRSATERMAHLFCELLLRLRAVGMAKGSECEMPATQSDLADALGVSAVHISRTLQELRGEGLVELKSKRLRIFDEPALQRLAMFNPSYLHLPEGANV